MPIHQNYDAIDTLHDFFKAAKAEGIPLLNTDPAEVVAEAMATLVVKSKKECKPAPKPIELPMLPLPSWKRKEEEELTRREEEEFALSEAEARASYQKEIEQ